MICERSSFGSSTVSVRGFSWTFIFPPFLSPRRIVVSVILGRQCFSISTTVAPPVCIFFIRRILVFYLILLFPVFRFAPSIGLPEGYSSPHLRGCCPSRTPLATLLLGLSSIPLSMYASLYLPPTHSLSIRPCYVPGQPCETHFTDSNSPLLSRPSRPEIQSFSVSLLPQLARILND